MRSEAIRRLAGAVAEIYGADRVSLYGSSADEEHGTAFTIKGIAATFSVHTREGTLPPDRYDIQIESLPPGEYLYTDVVTLEQFLHLVKRVAGPFEEWPTSSLFSADVARFREFLRKEGRPDRVEWIFRDDVAQVGGHDFIHLPLPPDNERAAELLHELGVKRGLGLAIYAFGHAAAVTYAYVAVPADQTDAEYKMIGNGTKLGMPERQKAVREVGGPVRWWLVKLRELFSVPSGFLDELPTRSEQ